jgi:glycosyltransferase involved in cell wall biosynthesis
VITPSYSVAKDVKTLFDKNSKVIPNGQFELLKLGSIVKENYFLYVGNPRFHKNLNNLITYFNSKSINFLKVVSDINLVNDLQNVEVYGKLDSKSEIIELIKKSRGIIMPSFCEGFGLPIIESLYYCGNAFSSDIDVFKEFYGLNIDYFDPNQLDQLNLTLNYNHQIIPRSKLKILNLFIWEELKYFLKKEFS